MGGGKMNKLYLVMAICALIMGAYFYGVNITNVKCQKQHIEQVFQNQNKLIQNQRIIHDTVYKTGVGDIRHILRDKYTIAE